VHGTALYCPTDQRPEDDLVNVKLLPAVAGGNVT